MKALWLIFLPILLLSAGCNKSSDEGKIPEVDSDRENSGEASLFILNQAITDEPENPVYFFKRSKIYYRTGNLQLALNDIDNAIHYNNTNPEFYFQLSKIDYAMHRLPMALKAAIASEELKSTDPELYILMSQIYMDLRNEVKSNEYLNKAEAIAPHHTDLFVLKARINAARGDTAAAIANLFTSIQRDEHNLSSYKELVRIYESSRKTDSALIFLTIGRSLSPHDPFFYYYDGRFFESLNFKKAAQKSYETALKSDSTYYLAYYSLALMAYKQENYSSALKNFVNVVKYDPTQKEANLYAAELYEKNNQGYEAISYYERARAADTANVKAKDALEKLYLQYPERKKIPAKDILSIKPDTSVIVKKDTIIKPVMPAPQSITPPVNNRPLNPKPQKKDSDSAAKTPAVIQREQVKKDTVK
ncbi:MAG TPA: tetratricopeptide repeat protein [Cytophagaceae bacterium]|jgi:tetratricopeptide (TPR) repeat protein|nr:tetratricopeptide repeat protein [Cytophagaceae bacterium]